MTTLWQRILKHRVQINSGSAGRPEDWVDLRATGTSGQLNAVEAWLKKNARRRGGGYASQGILRVSLTPRRALFFLRFLRSEKIAWEFEEVKRDS